MRSVLFRGRRRASLTAAAALFLLTGCSATTPLQTQATSASGATGHPSPVISRTADPTRTAHRPVKASTTAKPTLPAVMPASLPVSLSIPSIGTRTDLLELGLRENGTLEVPPDGPGAPAGWYRQSPTPGERGPAVLLGHVNAVGGGPGVFAGLRNLRPGDRVEVARRDGTVAAFTVVRGEQFRKDAFPTQTVYGNTKGSELRVITCDGYNPATGEFEDNYVVFATLAA